jgi:hypothetical protein
MNKQLRLWFKADNDGTGELFVEAMSQGFSGRGSAWFNGYSIIEFGETLSSTYPLVESSTYKLEGGYWSNAINTELEEVHIGLRFYPISYLGIIGCHVKLSTSRQNYERKEAQQSVQLEIKTSYEELKAFGLSLIALANGVTGEVILYGS